MPLDRDDFAASALMGILANPDPNMGIANRSGVDIAQQAWEMADLMLEERDRKDGPLFPLDELDDLDEEVAA